MSPTPITAALAGIFSGLVVPPLWSRLGESGAGNIGWIVAFLALVVLPAHAFVVGFAHSREPTARTVDTALLKRVGAWLVATAAAIAIAGFFHA
ncbi:hypothetical protein GCM10027034_28560 [Ramlibacter solisilvae]|uniref:Uncharacterized protein n=1 Tax=Ramlibacter tataouinensis TaxID=94132 RepID=A0A127JR35_9BURK|nr:hypothetical protein [Ramlibacter tataouinensis]AMO22478.1 hypothetical protein UC35_05695 [Ramlibacter tataouinensis]